MESLAVATAGPAAPAAALLASSTAPSRSGAPFTVSTLAGTPSPPSEAPVAPSTPGRGGRDTAVRTTGRSGRDDDDDEVESVGPLEADVKLGVSLSCGAPPNPLSLGAVPPTPSPLAIHTELSASLEAAVAKRGGSLALKPLSWPTSERSLSVLPWVAEMCVGLCSDVAVAPRTLSSLAPSTRRSASSVTDESGRWPGAGAAAAGLGGRSAPRPTGPGM